MTLLRLNIILMLLLLSVFSRAECLGAKSTKPVATKYFSSDYGECRKKFLEASQAVGASIESIKSPSLSPQGAPLFTDVALIGAKDAKDVLVLVSGTHGVEGFAGSGIQTALLNKVIASRLPPDMSVVMIHALNPYGFSHLRRFNEDNIDLNRNFLDHSKPHPENPGYEELAETISPQSISFFANIKSRLHFLWYRLKNGKLKLKEAISRGQYTHPKGLFYGGQSEAWSNKTIRDIAKRYLSNAEHVVFVDFHTGLGPYGHAEVILNVRENSPAYKRAKKWWGNRVKTTVSGQSISVHLRETLKLAIPKMLPNAEVTAVSLEFGTLPPMEVFWALRTENWLYHCCREGHPDAEKIKTELLRAFYPDDKDWKVQVWQQGKEVVEQAIIHIQ